MKGNTACRKRVDEKILPKVKFTTDRFTNSFKFVVGLKVPFLIRMKSVRTYVVVSTQEYMNQPNNNNVLTNGNPKVNKRRKLLELGISRNIKIWGRRKTHSTTFICRKGSSFTRSKNFWLEGHEKNEQLQKLKEKLVKGEVLTNLSEIMSDPNFLKVCSDKIKSKPENTFYTSNKVKRD